jgi:hypothetical protein
VWLVVASARAADSRKAEGILRDVKVMWSHVSRMIACRNEQEDSAIGRNE